jgi:hypothetical protein
MPEETHSTESAPRIRVTVTVESELAPRLNVGTRWEVVASSLSSLWERAYAVTLEEMSDPGAHDAR